MFAGIADLLKRRPTRRNTSCSSGSNLYMVLHLDTSDIADVKAAISSENLSR